MQSQKQLTMVINPPNIVLRLLPHILQKRLINWIKRIAKLKLTPQQDPPFVRKIIQEIGTVRARSPDSQHLLVAIDDAVEELAHLLDCHPRPKSVGRDEIGAFGVEFVAVDFEVPVIAGCYALVELGLGDGELVKDDCAEAGAFGYGR